MASKFEGTKPTIRQHDIEGYEVNLLIDGTGIAISRKGDKRKLRPVIKLTWSDAMEIGAARMKAAGTLKLEAKEFNGAYDFLGFE